MSLTRQRELSDISVARHSAYLWFQTPSRYLGLALTVRLIHSVNDWNTFNYLLFIKQRSLFSDFFVTPGVLIGFHVIFFCQSKCTFFLKELFPSSVLINYKYITEKLTILVYTFVHKSL